MKTIYKTLVLALLLICANAYAAGDYYTTNGTDEITFKNGAVIYVDFSLVTSVNVTGFEIANMGNCAVEKHLPTYVKLTFQENYTINNSNNGAGLHWQANNSGWQHNGKEWAKFFYGQDVLPFPAEDSNFNCIRVTLDGSGSAVYTWSDYTPGGAGGGGGGAGGGAGGETGVGGGEISVSEATGNGTISEAAGCEGCYKTTFVTK